MVRHLALCAVVALLAWASVAYATDPLFVDTPPAPDTTPPAVTLSNPANGSFTNDPTPLLSGGAGTAPTDSSTVTVKIWSGASTSESPLHTLTTTHSGGSWAIASPALADGPYTARAEHSDSAGNSGTSPTSTFTVDTIPPTVTLTNPPNGSSIAETTPTLSGAAGSASADSGTVTVVIWGGASASGSPLHTLTTTDSGGSWAIASPALADGPYTARAQQSDAAGNTGTGETATFTVDTTPPPAVTTTPPAGRYSTPQSVSLVSEVGAVIHYTTDGSDPTRASPTYTGPLTVSSSQTIKALALDSAGNRSAVATYAYTIEPYRDTVLTTPGLVSYWRFEETSGTTAADAKGTNPGSHRNGVALAHPGGLPSDAGGKSIRLDGTNDYVNVADRSPLDTGNAFTLESWVRRTSTSSASQTIFAKGSGSYLLRFNSNRLTLGRAGSGDIALATVTTTDTSGFHHVVAAKSGPTVKLYIDGVDVTGAVTNRTIVNTSKALNIGRVTDSRQYFPGYIDEAAVYNRALTAPQVLQHYEAGIASGASTPAPAPEPPPIAPHTNLIFSDDFTGSAGAAPNSAKWVAMNWCDGWGSLSCNTNRPQNVALDGAGSLRVRAIRESWNDGYGNTGTWTTGRLETQSKFSSTYGTVTARIKVPAGRGLWPSFWTTSWNKTGWPATGEIDVMELLGHDPQISYCSVHGANSSGQHVATTIPYQSPVSLAADFHVYEARWNPGQVDFYVDGARCGTISTADLRAFAPQQVLVGMAVGGSWPGSPDASTPSSADMLVDWVRVYGP